jgi:hypothetical protein
MFFILSFLFFLLQNQGTGRQNKSWPRRRAGAMGGRGVRETGEEGEYGTIKCIHMYVNAKCTS